MLVASLYHQWHSILFIIIIHCSKESETRDVRNREVQRIRVKISILFLANTCKVNRVYITPLQIIACFSFVTIQQHLHPPTLLHINLPFHVPCFFGMIWYFSEAFLWPWARERRSKWKETMDRLVFDAQHCRIIAGTMLGSRRSLASFSLSSNSKWHAPGEWFSQIHLCLGFLEYTDTPYSVPTTPPTRITTCNSSISSLLWLFPRHRTLSIHVDVKSKAPPDKLTLFVKLTFIPFLLIWCTRSSPSPHSRSWISCCRSLDEDFSEKMSYPHQRLSIGRRLSTTSSEASTSLYGSRSLSQ